MAAFAAAEHLAAHAELPHHFKIECRSWEREATVAAYAHHDIGLLSTWQRRFGGELRHEIYDGRQHIKFMLSGRVFDVPFTMWTLLDVTPELATAEAELRGRWITERGSTTSWPPQTQSAYAQALAELFVGVAE